MNVYKLTLMVFDHEGLGEQEITRIIQGQKYPDWCIFPKVIETQSVDIGPWRYDHPLNDTTTQRDEFNKLFEPLSDDLLNFVPRSKLIAQIEDLKTELFIHKESCIREHEPIYDLIDSCSDGTHTLADCVKHTLKNLRERLADSDSAVVDLLRQRSSLNKKLELLKEGLSQASVKLNPKVTEHLICTCDEYQKDKGHLESCVFAIPRI